MSEHTDVARRVLDDWDTRACVRTRPDRYALEPGDLDDERGWFAPHELPFMGDPLVAGLSARQHQLLLGLLRLQFFEYGAVLEHEIVNLTTIELVQQDTGLDIPDELRVDAYKVYTDEAYHAMLGMQFAEQLGRYTGVGTRRWPPHSGRLDAIRAASSVGEGSTRDALLLRFGATVLTEVTISKELADGLRGVLIRPIYNFLRDHLHDESRHALFYTALFGAVWPQLSRREQLVLGVALPSMILAFNHHDEPGLLEALCFAGLTRADAEEVVRRYYTEDEPLRRARRRIGPLMRMLQRSGVFEHREIYESFRDHGFEVVS